MNVVSCVLDSALDFARVIASPLMAASLLLSLPSGIQAAALPKAALTENVARPSASALGCKSYSFEKVSGKSLDRDLEEMSGLILGGLEPGTLVHVQDSGNDPELIYTKVDGSIIARYPYAERATDVEELARGECPDGGSCIYVFDSGDNLRWRGTRSIWAVEESSLRAEQRRSQRIDYSFPKNERLDVEAAVWIKGTIFLFAKEPKHSRVFALDLTQVKDGTIETKYVTDLPYTMITGATATKDGQRIMLLSWQGVIELSKELERGSLKSSDSWYPYRRRMKIKGLAQQEAISYDQDQRSFFYSSEKKSFSDREWGIMHARCLP